MPGKKKKKRLEDASDYSNALDFSEEDFTNLHLKEDALERFGEGTRLLMTEDGTLTDGGGNPLLRLQR